MPTQRLIFDLRQGGSVQLNLSHNLQGELLPIGLVELVLHSSTGQNSIRMTSTTAGQILNAFLGALHGDD